MSTCVMAVVQDPRSIYPVFDLRRMPGPGGWRFGYAFALDAVEIEVTPTPGLSRGEMRVILNAKLSEQKAIQGVNLPTNTAVSVVESSLSGTAEVMTITRRGPDMACNEGADTLVLCRDYAWPQGRTALYTFDPRDLWDFWGGCTVRFTWDRDIVGSGRWGDQTPRVVYPQVPNGSLMFTRDGTGFIQVFGDAGFPVSTTYLNKRGIRLDSALPAVVSRRLPGDGTLVREFNRPEVFVIYGGAKFHIPNLAQLGFNAGQVGVVPPDGLKKVGTVPFDGTLLQELSDARVFLVENGMRRWVTSPASMNTHFLPTRYVRTVLDGALTSLMQGPELPP